MIAILPWYGNWCYDVMLPNIWPLAWEVVSMQFPQSHYSRSQYRVTMNDNVWICSIQSPDAMVTNDHWYETMYLCSVITVIMPDTPQKPQWYYVCHMMVYWPISLLFPWWVKWSNNLKNIKAMLLCQVTVSYVQDHSICWCYYRIPGMWNDLCFNVYIMSFAYEQDSNYCLFTSPG